jgi:hypothetical protein
MGKRFLPAVEMTENWIPACAGMTKEEIAALIRQAHSRLRSQ